MRLRPWRTLPALPNAKRKIEYIPWARICLLLIIVAIVVYVGVPAYSTIAADGVVAGDLAPVVSMYQARVVHNLVHCDDRVEKGQPIAVISNFLLEANYSDERQKYLAQLAVERVAQSDGLTAARIAEDTAKQQYDAALIDAEKKKAVFEAYDRTYLAGGIGRVVWGSARSDWQAAQAQAQAYEGQLETAKEHLQRVRIEGTEKITTLNEGAEGLEAMASRVRSETLNAPVSGYVVQCQAHPDQVVEAGSPIYEVFGTDRAYALAFFNPSQIGMLHIGDKAMVNVTGIDDPLVARVAAISPSLSRLPDALTKYFWQHEQWNEYREVRLSFRQLSPALRRQLTYNAQLHVSITHRTLPWLNNKLSLLLF